MVTDNIEKPEHKSRHRGWLQNEPRSCEAATGITSEFSEWFELAKAQGLL